MDKLHTLKVFVVVADTLSFAQAARTLRLSPAATTRAVAALERELGAALFRRTTRSVVLTPEGAAYLERCRHALAELEDAAHALRGESAAPRGLLVVSAPVVFGRMHILPVITELLRTHAELEIRLQLTDRIVRPVDEGIDVAVRIAFLPDTSLHAVQIGAAQLVTVASSDYLCRRGTPLSVGDLRQHDLIAFEGLAATQEWRFGSGKGVQIKPRLTTDNADAALAAAVEGIGIARMLSYQAAEHVAAGKLVRLLPDHEPSCVPITLLFQSNRQRSPNVRALVQAARMRMRAVGGSTAVTL